MITGKEDIVRAITEALALEKGTREFYQYAASKAKGSEARDMFGALRDMEDRHMRYFDFLYLAVSEDRDLLGYRDFSSKIAATHVESGVTVSQAEKLFDERAVTSNREALKIALAIEGKAHALYKRMADAASDPDVKVIFEEMMAQETKHIEYLKDLEKTL